MRSGRREFAEAAATVGKFWEMHDMLYENQQALTDRDLSSYAKHLGLDAKLIESALGGQFTARVQHDFSSGRASGCQRDTLSVPEWRTL